MKKNKLSIIQLFLFIFILFFLNVPFFAKADVLGGIINCSTSGFNGIADFNYGCNIPELPSTESLKYGISLDRLSLYVLTGTYNLPPRMDFYYQDFTTDDGGLFSGNTLSASSVVHGDGWYLVDTSDGGNFDGSFSFYFKNGHFYSSLEEANNSSPNLRLDKFSGVDVVTALGGVSLNYIAQFGGDSQNLIAQTYLPTSNSYSFSPSGESHDIYVSSLNDMSSCTTYANCLLTLSSFSIISSNISSATSTPPDTFNYYDWLTFCSLVLAFISFPIWSYFFGFWRKAPIHQ